MGYWIQSRYEGKCSECECDFVPGDRIFYEPNDKGRADTYCRSCGEDADDVRRDDDDLELKVEV